MRSLKYSIFLLSIIFVGCATQEKAQESIAYSQQMLNHIPFIEHAEPGPFHSWLGRNVEYLSVEQVRKKLEEKLGLSLINRGEAHITVISPVEYDQVLSKKISIQKINEIASLHKIQEINFEPLCIGRGQANPDGRGTLYTYYVVLKSPQLEEIRKAIADEFIRAGGTAYDFRPDYWFPHITLGFNKRDLYLEDGVYKDEKSCLYKLKAE